MKDGETIDRREAETRVLVISNLFPLPWEPQRATFNREQFRHLARRMKVSVLVPVAFPQWLSRYSLAAKKPAQPELPGITLKYVPYFYIPRFGRASYGFSMALSLLLYAFGWARKQRPDVVLGSWIYPDGVAACLFAKVLRLPLVLKVHGSDVNDHGRFRLRALQIISISRYASAIVCVSQALANRLVEIGVQKDKLQVVYNGLDHKVFKQVLNEQANVSGPDTANGGVGEAIRSLLYVGNIKRSKGVFDLFTAFMELSARYPDLQLVYIGSGPDFPELRSQVEGAGLIDRVSFLSSQPQTVIVEWMNKATMLVLPSYNEGVPNVVLEAMACGLPSVVSRVGGVPEVVADGQTGRMFSAGDCNDLVSKIVESLDYPWDRELISASSMRYDWDMNSEQLADLLTASASCERLSV